MSNRREIQPNDDGSSSNTKATRLSRVMAAAGNAAVGVAVRRWTAGSQSVFISPLNRFRHIAQNQSRGSRCWKSSGCSLHSGQIVLSVIFPRAARRRYEGLAGRREEQIESVELTEQRSRPGRGFLAGLCEIVSASLIQRVSPLIQPFSLTFAALPSLPILVSDRRRVFLYIRSHFGLTREARNHRCHGFRQ